MPKNGATPLATGAPATAASTLLVDWGSAPDDAIFYGRQSELDTLQRWVIEDRCRLITLLGMGGIGKNSAVGAAGEGDGRWEGG